MKVAGFKAIWYCPKIINAVHFNIPWENPFFILHKIALDKNVKTIQWINSSGIIRYWQLKNTKGRYVLLHSM